MTTNQLVRITNHPAHDCQLCPLAATRQNVVWGNGNPNANIMLVGEAPGANEDASGIPFIGIAGNILNASLRAAGLSREEIYITNRVKCRPLSDEGRNRQPNLNETESCTPWLRLELSSVQPSVVLVMGRTSAELAFIHAAKHPVGRARVMALDGRQYIFLATYHPAYIARQRSQQWILTRDLMRAKELARLCQPII